MAVWIEIDLILVRNNKIIVREKPILRIERIIVRIV